MSHSERKGSDRRGSDFAASRRQSRGSNPDLRTPRSMIERSPSRESAVQRHQSPAMRERGSSTLVYRTAPNEVAVHAQDRYELVAADSVPRRSDEKTELGESGKQWSASHVRPTTSLFPRSASRGRHNSSTVDLETCVPQFALRCMGIDDDSEEMSSQASANDTYR
jgi:hypothetical protein